MVMVSAMRLARAALWAGLGALALSGCSWFDDEEVLPGNRTPVRAEADLSAPDAAEAARPLPPTEPRANWTQTNATPEHNAGHLAGPTGFSEVWRADAGTGTSEDSALTSSPIVDGGRIYVLDAAAEVTAFDANSGDERWQTSLVPNEEEDGEEGFGGGLAIEGDRLIATTGFGEVLALSPATGEILWRQHFGAPFRAAPALAGGLIVAVTRDSQSFGIDAADGTIRWRHQGVTPNAAFIGGASPAIAGGLALVPYASGELVALEAQTGRLGWAAVMTGGRRGLARAAITDLTGDPVAIGPFVVTANQSGRIAAFEGRTGRRAWTRAIGSTQPPWPAGDSLFLISDTAVLMRLDARSGQTLWEQHLPEYEDEEDFEDPITYSGPLLIAGRVVFTDSLGNLWSFDGETGGGEIIAELPDGAITGPVVVGNTLYVLTEEATLVALR